MAYNFSVNQTPSTGSVAMFTFISALTTAGWSKVRDSDGTTYSPSGAQVTSGAAGGNGLANNNAWVVLQAPVVGSNTRSICIQRGTTNIAWRVKYSANSQFVGGSPSAAQVPSATDEAIMMGAGSDASPTYFNYLQTDGTYRFHVVAGGAAEFYTFCAYTLITSGTVVGKFWFMDMMATGSFSPLDTDVAVIGFNNSTAVVDFLNSASTATNPRPGNGWLGATNSISNFVGIGAYSFGNFTPHSGGTSYGNSPFSSKDTSLPLLWCRTSASAAPVGTKGLSSLFRLNSLGRTSMDVFNVVGVRDFVYVSGLQLPWDGSIPTI